MFLSSENLRVVICHSDRDFVFKLRDGFSARPDYLICAIATDGRSAIQEIQRYQPHVIIVDVHLPEIDGFGVVEHLSFMDLRSPKIFMCSISSDEYTLKKSKNMGVDYLFIKPVNLDIFFRRVDEIALRKFSSTSGSIINIPTKNLELIISSYMNSIHILPNVSGYHYLLYAIKLAVNDLVILDSITKRLYPMVASQYNTTPQRVERSMRHAIESSFRRGSLQMLEEMFGNSINEKNGKPSNSEFVALMANRIRIQMSNVE